MGWRAADAGDCVAGVPMWMLVAGSSREGAGCFDMMKVASVQKGLLFRSIGKDGCAGEPADSPLAVGILRENEFTATARALDAGPMHGEGLSGLLKIR